MKTKFKKIGTLAILSVMAITMLGGCSSQDEDVSEEEATTTTVSETTTTTAASDTSTESDGDSSSLTTNTNNDDSTSNASMGSSLNDSITDSDITYEEGTYENQGFSVDIPDGWSLEVESYGQRLTADKDNEYASYFDYCHIDFEPEQYVMVGYSETVDETSLATYFDAMVEGGNWYDYEIGDSGDMTINGMSAKYYDVHLTWAYYLLERYIVIDNEVPYCIVIRCYDDEEVISMVMDVLDSISDSIVLPDTLPDYNSGITTTIS